MLHVLWLLSALAAVGPAACDVFVVNAKRNLEYKMDAEMSTFGPMLAWKGMSGVLMSGRPANGCLPLEVSPPANRGGRHWFVLLAKANCTPNVQVAHGQHAGFDAVIVHNVGSNVVSPMSGYDAADVPSVFVGESNGILLEVNFLYYSGYHLVLTGNYSFTFYAFLIPCILLCFGCLLILCAIMLCRYICARRRAARRILPKKILDAIPTKRFEPATDPWDTCAVCLEDYVAGDVVRMLPCRHAFHRDCVDPWLTRTKRSCPVCKRRVLSATAAMACMDSEEDDDVMESQRGDRAPLVRPRARRIYGATSTAVEPAAVQQAHVMVHRVLAANPQPPPPPPPAQHVPGHVRPERPRLHGHRCPSDPRHMSDNRASSATESVSQQAPAPAPTSEPSLKPHPELTVKPSSARSPDSAPEPCQSVPETGRQPCFGAVSEPGRGSCSEYAPKGDESAAVASDSVSVEVVPAADKLATPDTDQV